MMAFYQPSLRPYLPPYDHRVGSYSPSTNSLWHTGGFLINRYSLKKFLSRNKKLFSPIQPPDCIFIFDTDSKSSVINEAHNLHIPVVAIVDSSMPLHSFYPDPANPFRPVCLFVLQPRHQDPPS
ncbi:hypothetical protein AAHE18_01G193200 [Arachis hypogaea]